MNTQATRIKTIITLFNFMVVFHFIFVFDMAFTIFHAWEEAKKNKKKLILVRIMNNANRNSENIMNHVGVFNNNATINNIA